MTAHLGKGIDDKILKKVEGYLEQWIDKNEKVIAIFNASRITPTTIGGIVLTSQRILLAKKSLILKVEFSDEIAADEIKEFTSEKGLLKKIKLYLTKKDGEKLYVGSMRKEDAVVVSGFLVKMSGAPRTIAKKMDIAKNAELEAKEKETEAKQVAKKLLPKKEYNANNFSTGYPKEGLMGLFSSRKNKKKKKVAIQQILLSLKNEAVLNIRSSLRKDRELLITNVVATIKQHWNTLEYKFEQHIDEDDYGNIIFSNGIEKEFIYFSENVILPVLQHRIDNNETSNKDLTLILQDTLKIIEKFNEDYFDIKFEVSSSHFSEHPVQKLLRLSNGFGIGSW